MYYTQRYTKKLDVSQYLEAKALPSGVGSVNAIMFFATILTGEKFDLQQNKHKLSFNTPHTLLCIIAGSASTIVLGVYTQQIYLTVSNSLVPTPFLL